MEALLDDNCLSGKLWPAHLKPKGDELLTSWMVRLSLAHGLQPDGFKSLVWPNLSYFWGIDIDRTIDQRIFRRLAKKTGTSTTEVFNTTLSSYGERLHAYTPLKGPVKWLMPVNTSKRNSQKRYGLQFCPICLLEDSYPYFRRKWRLAFVFLCEKHGTLLLDECPNCSAPVSHYKNAQSSSYEVCLNALVTCYGCGFDLRDASKYPRLAEADEVRFQISLLSTLEQGWIDIPQHGPVFSCLYFEGLNRLMRSICKDDEFPRIQENIVNYYGIKLPILSRSDKNTTIEICRIPGRRVLVAMLRRLIEDWPDGFINFCEANKVWQYALFRHMEYMPFWYWSVVSNNLNRGGYSPTDQEFTRAIEHERKMGREPHKGTLSKYFSAHICSKRLRKKKMTIKARKGLTGYPASLRKEAVLLYKEGNSFAEIARNLHVAFTSVRRWIKECESRVES